MPVALSLAHRQRNDEEIRHRPPTLPARHAHHVRCVRDHGCDRRGLCHSRRRSILLPGGCAGEDRDERRDEAITHHDVQRSTTQEKNGGGTRRFSDGIPRSLEGGNESAAPFNVPCASESPSRWGHVTWIALSPAIRVRPWPYVSTIQLRRWCASPGAHGAPLRGFSDPRGNRSAAPRLVPMHGCHCSRSMQPHCTPPVAT